jgi:hypothetical protein
MPCALKCGLNCLSKIGAEERIGYAKGYGEGYTQAEEDAAVLRTLYARHDVEMVTCPACGREMVATGMVEGLMRWRGTMVCRGCAALELADAAEELWRVRRGGGRP